MIELLIWGLISLVTGAVALKYWDRIRESVAAWLRAKGLNQSALMAAWIGLDFVASKARSKLWVRTAAGPEMISEETISLDEIDDPEVRRRLRAGDHVELDVLQLVR